MNVLVLGGSGYIGSRLCIALAASGWATPVSASARRATPGFEHRRVDTRDAVSLTRALQGMDAVVNCVAGDAASIAQGAATLAQACAAAQCSRIVHLSSMSVYGSREGPVREQAPFDPSLGWYARAKCAAEARMADFAREGGTVVTLRPGCVWGPGSQLWVGRIGRWLRAGRLGDLGTGGDGWSNLVHVDDVCHAIAAALQLPVRPGALPAFNLAAPDSPRWNEYFVDLALAIGATPVRRIGRRQLRADSLIAGAPLKIAQRALAYVGKAALVPDPLPPGLLGLWSQHIHLDAAAAAKGLGVAWTSYESGLRSSAGWFIDQHPAPRGITDKAACTH